MKITNKLSYPDSVVKAAKESLYFPSWEVSHVTELIDSPLIKHLTIKHWDDLTVDTDEFINSSLFGTAWHKFLAGYEIDSAFVEKHWSLMVNDVLVSGTTDIYKDSGIVEDNKVTSAWAFVFGRVEWEYQLNLYAYLIKENNYPVNSLWINAFLRDWSQYTAMQNRNKDYPDSRFYRVQIPLWSVDKQKQYLLSRLKAHTEDREKECTPEQRWQRKEQFALAKKDRKTAIRVLDTKDEMLKYINQKNLTKQFQNGTIYIEHRPGSCVRCNNYCPVRDVCKYKE